MEKQKNFYISIILGFVLIVLWSFASNKYIKILSYIIWVISLIIGQGLEYFEEKKNIINLLKKFFVITNIIIVFLIIVLLFVVLT